MSFRLIELTDQHLTRPKVHFPGNDFFNPSASSVRWLDKHNIPRVSGTCLRASYYRYTGQQSLPTDAYSEWIFRLGKAVEEILVEEWKQLGIWVANNVKFYDKEYNISGEIDVLLADPETQKLCMAEVKSFFGYYATKELCGTPRSPGSARPKTSHLLQTLIYVDVCQRYGLLDYGKLVYYARDSAKRNEFDIEIIQDGEHRRPMVNGVIDYRFTIQEIYDRFNELQGYLDRQELPPPDYEMKWDHEKVEQFYQLDEVSKTAYEQFKRNPAKYPIGDWQCRYCQFRNMCGK